jgi:GT2 family glycosyltransferase
MRWLPRCYESLERQTIFSEIEVILTDNNSSDGSDKFAAAWGERTGRGRVVQNGANLYYCGANNNGAAVATGEFVLFLNNDTWLEPDCLEKLYAEATKAGADCAAPTVLNYDDDTFQGIGSDGLDLFGMHTQSPQLKAIEELFSGYGCSVLLRKDVFDKVGGFAPELLIYADESDLSWRVWIAGGKVMSAPGARVHHRGSAVVNPQGNTITVEARTSDTKRFLANRNGILLLLKNSQHILLLLVIPHLVLLLVEAMVSLLLVRRWSYVRKAYLSAILEAFKMHGHVREWRRRIRGFRQRGDFWMLRFLRFKLSRWDEVKRLFKFGLPKVDAK